LHSGWRLITSRRKKRVSQGERPCLCHQTEPWCSCSLLCVNAGARYSTGLSMQPLPIVHLYQHALRWNGWVQRLCQLYKQERCPSKDAPGPLFIAHLQPQGASSSLHLQHLNWNAYCMYLELGRPWLWDVLQGGLGNPDQPFLYGRSNIVSWAGQWGPEEVWGRGWALGDVHSWLSWETAGNEAPGKS
jgi:hypothetical protein